MRNVYERRAGGWTLDGLTNLTANKSKFCRRRTPAVVIQACVRGWFERLVDN